MHDSIFIQLFANGVENQENSPLHVNTGGFGWDIQRGRKWEVFINTSASDVTCTDTDVKSYWIDNERKQPKRLKNALVWDI